jgi:hypothetical protein
MYERQKARSRHQNHYTFYRFDERYTFDRARLCHAG